MDSHNTSRVGEIVLLASLQKTEDGSHAQPAVIVSELTEPGSEVLVASITSETADRDGHSRYAVPFNRDDLDYGSVAGENVIRIDQLVTVPQDRIARADVGRLKREKMEKMLRTWSELLCDTFYKAVHRPSQKARFIPAQSRIPYAGRVFDAKEVSALVDASLDFWLTTGRYSDAFEKRFASFLGVRYCSLTNSGSSANLLAFMALTSPKLGERRINPGDEVITVAAAFPTTVAPIVQYGAVPVFVDVALPTYNIDCSQLEHALSEKTKAVMLAHTLGNPFDLQTVRQFCSRHNLWLIEDNCDALGSKYLIDGEWKYTGTIGDLGTSSFYPPHHMTMGEGGAVYTSNGSLKRLVESFRDWGRDCWCASGCDNTCGKRFEQKFGDLPQGYDHKYVYSHFGYNLKVTEMQAAIGCAQLEKLPGFIAARKKNWQSLRNRLADFSECFILPEPTPDSDPSWFGFLLTVREGSGPSREQLVKDLEAGGIQTRMLFAGNLLKHPCFDTLRRAEAGYRVVSPAEDGSLPVTETIMNRSFWLGVYPGMQESMIDYIAERISSLLTGRKIL